tara:strand:+ start:8536 stop:9267 length:732 start_codon:yes stop_codon:yes gene_type:complete
MPKLKRFLMVSMTLNAIFILVAIWMLWQKGGLSYLQLQFSETDQVPYQAKPYEQGKRDRFEEFAKSLPKGGVVLLGDSLTENGPWAETFPDSYIRNRGIRGDTTQGVLRRLDEIIDAQPEQIFLLIGINDLRNRVPPHEIAENYAIILDRLRRDCPQASLYTQSVLPTQNNVFGVNYLQIEDLNEQIAALAAERKIKHLHLYSDFTIYGNQPDPVCFSDGLHLSTKGYLRWAKLLAPHLHLLP